MRVELLAELLNARSLPPAKDCPVHYDAVLITGPTASGKSALSLDLGALWPAANIAVDSALVYRSMDIGTAKPSAAEQALMPHYGMDLIDPAQRYSVAQFLADAQAGIDHARAVGRMPLLVGGTMMYVNALYQGLSPLPAGDAAIRVQIEGRAANVGWPALHAELVGVDPNTAARLAPNDAQRIERALEVYHATGKPLSAWLAQTQASPALISKGRWLHLSIEPPRNTIWQRVANRFDTMLDSGFLDEVAELRARGDLDENLPSIRCVGYRQAWQHLAGELSYAEFRERAVIASRQLAKRQMTWLRGMEQRVVVVPN